MFDTIQMGKKIISNTMEVEYGTTEFDNQIKNYSSILLDSVYSQHKSRQQAERIINFIRLPNSANDRTRELP